MSVERSLTMDLATMQFVTETAAKAAAVEIGRSLRVEIREELVAFERSMLEKIQAEMRNYFGGLNGDTHIVQHSQLAGFIEAKKGAIGGFVRRMGELVAAALGGALIYGAGLKELL